MTSPLIVSLLLAGWVTQQPSPSSQTPPAAPAPAPAQTPAAPQKPLSGNLKVRVATQTYVADGRVLTAQANNWPLVLNQPLTVFVTSGKTMCDSRAPAAERATDAGPGWNVQITPVRETASELELRVQWNPLAGVSASTAPFAAAASAVQLTLHPGDRVIVDYMSPARRTGFFFNRSPLTIEPKTPQLEYAKRLRRVETIGERPSADGCSALGMGLEIGLDAAKTDAFVEAEVWLVRPNRDGTELSERQVLRLPLGQAASSYYFEEQRLLAARPAMKGAAPLAKVFGNLAAFSVENGKIHLNFSLSRRYEANQPTAETTNTYRDLIATPGEVLAFQLPASDSPPLSVRLRAQVVR